MLTARWAILGSSGGRNRLGPLSTLLPLPWTCSIPTRAPSAPYQRASIGWPSSRRSSTSSVATATGVAQLERGGTSGSARREGAGDRLGGRQQLLAVDAQGAQD